MRNADASPQANPWDLFKPNEALACDLFYRMPQGPEDGAHDLSHLLRVWRNVRLLMAEEGGDLTILTAACILHDCVAAEKDAPGRAVASTRSAARASSLLQALGWPQNRISAVAHAIEAHSFSAGIPPTSMEAKVLQDADRLDAIGYVGIARCFYVSGRMARALYDPQDPIAANRDLDDLRFAADHFQTKLLRLAGSFQTATGNRMAAQRHAVTQGFFDGLMAEIEDLDADK